MKHGLKRRLALIGSALLLHSSWGPEAKWLCNPVLSCHSCALAWFACPIGVLLHYPGAYQLFPYAALGTVLLVGVLIGRLLCGWVCPFGLLQDLLYRIPSPKFVLPDWTAHIKYVVLALMVFLLPWFFGVDTWFSFCRVCPAAAIQVTLPAIVQQGMAAISWGTVLRLSILVGVLGLAVLSSRSFCKVICPIGALLAPLNLISFWRVKPPRTACITCLKCTASCPTDVRPMERLPKQIPANRALDCIVCHDCQAACASTIKPGQPGGTPCIEPGCPQEAKG